MMASFLTRSVLPKVQSPKNDTPKTMKSYASFDSTSESNIFDWRLSPEESFSDWTIEIIPMGKGIRHVSAPSSSLSGAARCDDVCANRYNHPNHRNLDNQTRLTEQRKKDAAIVYHVHRWVLASGPQRSEYFRRLFEEEALSHQRKKKQQPMAMLNKARKQKKPKNITNSRSEMTAQTIDDEISMQAMFVEVYQKVSVCLGDCMGDVATYATTPVGCDLQAMSIARNIGKPNRNTTRLILPDVAVHVFSRMLDFIYGDELDSTGQRNERAIQITTETATALHFLAVRFEVKRLEVDAKLFWMRDMDLSNCHIYYQHARQCEDFDPVLNAVAKICQERFLGVWPDSPVILYCTNELPFWLKILKSLEITKSVSLHASRLVTAILMLNQTKVDASVFDAFTDARFLPYVDKECVEDLLTLHHYYQTKKGELCTNHAKVESDTTCLELRCMDAIVEHCISRPQSFSEDKTLTFLKHEHPALWSLLHQNLECAIFKARKDEIAVMELSEQFAMKSSIGQEAQEEDNDNYESFSPNTSYTSNQSMTWSVHSTSLNSSSVVKSTIGASSTRFSSQGSRSRILSSSTNASAIDSPCTSYDYSTGSSASLASASPLASPNFRAFAQTMPVNRPASPSPKPSPVRREIRERLQSTAINKPYTSVRQNSFGNHLRYDQSRLEDSRRNNVSQGNSLNTNSLSLPKAGKLTDALGDKKYKENMCQQQQFPDDEFQQDDNTDKLKFRTYRKLKGYHKYKRVAAVANAHATYHSRQSS